MAKLLVLGWGKIGGAIGLRCARRGWSVMGVRRGPIPMGEGSVFTISADASQADTWPMLMDAGPFDAVLLAANPGLRAGGEGNGLAVAAALVREHLPDARFVYTSSTAVYGNTDGAAIDEAHPVATQGRAAQLHAIETTVLQQADASVLRIGAIVGPGRGRSRERVKTGVVEMKGSPDRQFPFMHEADVLAVCEAAVTGELVPGLYNVVAPQELTYRHFYQGLARSLQLPPVQIVGDDSEQPNRRVIASKLQQQFPQRRWLLPWE